MITVIGSSNTDFTIKVKRLPKVGETLSGGEVFQAHGGKGANQAAQLAKLQKRVSFIGNIGKDIFGDKSVANLKKLGVNTKFVFRDNLHNSGLAFIIVDKDGRNQIIVSPGSNHHFKVRDLLKARGLIEKSDILLLQMEIPCEVVKRAINIAHKERITIILNPAPYRFKLEGNVLSKVDILTPNEIEAEMISGIKIRNESSIKKAGSVLLKKGVKHVIITRGKRGATIVDQNGARTFRVNKVRVIDTTCAGDSFNAALAAAVYDGKTIDEAAKFANIAASLTVTKLGAQSSLPDASLLKNRK